MASLGSDEAETQSASTPVRTVRRNEPVQSVESLKPTLEEVREVLEEKSYTPLEQELLGKAYAKRGVHQGGRRRTYAPWFKDLAYHMADRRSLNEAAAKIGKHFSRKDQQKLWQLKEFQRLVRAYRRLYVSECWGQPNQEEVLARLIMIEDRKSLPEKRPRGAHYISRIRKPLP